MVSIPLRNPEEDTIDCGWHQYSKTEYVLLLSAPAKRFRFERHIQNLSHRIITTYRLLSAIEHALPNWPLVDFRKKFSKMGVRITPTKRFS
jgi:hypothetical protein